MSNSIKQLNSLSQSPDLTYDIPAVSWLICTHMANEQLRVALNSCLSQSFTNFECVVVVNGQAAELIANTIRQWFCNDLRIRIFTTDVKHLTFSLALGLHYARAPLIARMDADDVSTPDRLAMQVSFMEAHPEVSVLGSDYEIIDQTGTCIDIVNVHYGNIAIRKALLRGNPFCHPSVVFRRDIALAVGGYLGGIYAQDYDLWSRLAVDRTVVFANLPHVCLRYRMVGVGNARRARWSYASVAGSQFRNFVAGAGWSWAWAAFLSAAKAFIRSRTAHHSIG
jgi:glycosyltransferase involved in cell wall biosynthesis